MTFVWQTRGVYWYMKVVYICAAQSLGSLGSGPSLKMGGFQSGPSMKNEGWGVGTKNNKETYTFKSGVFWSSPCRKVEQTNVYVWKGGSFGAVQVEKVESLGAAQAEKWGAFGRHIPVLP